MKYILRPYQIEAVQAAVSHLSDPKAGNGLMCIPTGAGKSLIIAEIAAKLESTVLVFQPSKEILEQNAEKMRGYGINPGIYSASAGRRDIKQVTLATIGSVVNKASSFEKFKYVIIDECHGVNAKGDSTMYVRFLSAIPGVRVLGLTATPYRLSTDGFGGSILKFLTRTRPRVFDKLIYYIQTKRLFDEGHLCKLEYYSIKGFERSQVKLNSTGADYADVYLQRYMQRINFPDQVCGIVKRLVTAGRKNILVFTRFVEEAEYVSQRIKGSVVITAQTGAKQREMVIRQFKEGKIKVVCNVGVLTTGFDYPELETVVLARPTMSLSLYYQMCGRGVRPHPEKKSAWIIDMCQNMQLFGKVEDLEIKNKGGEKWVVCSGSKQLTNIYYGDKPEYGHKF